MRKLIYYGNPILRKKCEEIKEITPEIRQLVHEMKHIMDEKEGIGIAAPQIGVSLSLFILRRYTHDEKSDKWSMTEPYVYINPKILNYTEESWIDEEGCLSIPGLRVLVPRPWGIKLQAQDLEGESFIYEVEGINARCIMHENDHLHGTLQIDRTDPKTKKQIEPKLREIKHKYSHN